MEIKKKKIIDWLKDIQELYRQTGVRLENSIFLLNDNNINDDQMYVDLNCIISSGIVYNLFTGEEKFCININKNYKEIINNIHSTTESLKNQLKTLKAYTEMKKIYSTIIYQNID